MSQIKSRTRLLITLTLILALAFVGGSLINYLLTRAAIHKEIVSKDLPLTMDNIYSDLTNELLRPILVSSSMANDTFLKDWAANGEKDSVLVIRYLEQIRLKYGFFTTFFVSAQTGRYYHFSGLHKTISPTDQHDVWYYTFVASDKEYNLDVDTDEASDNTLTIFINNRVVDRTGRLLGVAGVGLKVDNAAVLIAKYREKYGRTVYLSDRKGLIQVHQNRQYVESKNIRDIEGLGSVAADVLTSLDQPATFEYQHNSEQILLNVRYIAALDWFLFVEQNETEALSGARMNVLRTLLIGLAASVIIIVVTLLTINRYQSQLEKLIVTDDLTGIANRRQLEAEFRKAIYVYSRSRQVFSLILMDLDGFKQVNDRVGHQAGDEVLVTIAGLISAAVRPTDIPARWGGDEFTALVQGDAGDAGLIAERIRTAVMACDLAVGGGEDDPRRGITLSAGISQYRPDDSLDSMLVRADEALYRCKKMGGNRIRIDKAEDC